MPGTALVVALAFALCFHKAALCVQVPTSSLDWTRVKIWLARPAGSTERTSRCGRHHRAPTMEPPRLYSALAACSFATRVRGVSNAIHWSPCAGIVSSETAFTRRCGLAMFLRQVRRPTLCCRRQRMGGPPSRVVHGCACCSVPAWVCAPTGSHARPRSSPAALPLATASSPRSAPG